VVKMACLRKTREKELKIRSKKTGKNNNNNNNNN